ncbi:cupin domain-containing protein [Acidothermaceae bacterium B102]|nr:cupin domain-containing protein [Acidothermaceae bacterium B102]
MSEPLRLVGPPDLSPETGQTSGMQRSSAISAATVGAAGLWMGETRMAPATVSGNHHHGDSETAIYVVSGHPVFVFLGDEGETRLSAAPGDYVYVPAFTPHREENPDPEQDAVVVLARSTQEAMVVNLDSLG